MPIIGLRTVETGVQRWMHFSRHLKALGWDITVFTLIILGVKYTQQ